MSDWIKDTLYSNGVLKNKFHIHDPKLLEEIEYRESNERALLILQKQPKIKDISYLAKIHKFMFNSLYDWAGEYRPGNFQKNGYEFFDHSRFEFAEQNINSIMKQQPTKEPLQVEDYAKLLDEINFMHPFREGNGRSTKTFLQAYAANHEQVLDYPRQNDEMIQAQNEADVKHISRLLKVQNSPTREVAFKTLVKQHKERQTETLSQAELAAQYEAQKQQQKGLELE
ncbi:Fic family protein (plasmid) [Lactobacillus sp. ESL0731]|uniref:Fic/DOC family protein n=1 Tax=unclassified Lactobacillus TaxID=2620435 RepID=UPI0023F765BA|nr:MULTISPECIES: Fic family protein [unclassified Lactobacillus]WEV52122.1 Fic family protein [Lactobacillus sp. ESL0700]WEV63245.1 Fic family protein [Lactobacillus sp. ESL0731]